MSKHNKNIILALSLIIIVSLACNVGGKFKGQIQPKDQSVFDLKKTAYGFFPSPPEASIQSIISHFGNLSKHADFVLMQLNIPWEDFLTGIEEESKKRDDIYNQFLLAQSNNLEWVIVVDPLNGLNRKEFYGLPESWEASFNDRKVRQAYINFTMWLVEKFQPRYLGLASEINTYMDAFPQDKNHFISLYLETYKLVKNESPNTQVFVTFQWEDLNNLFPEAAEGRKPFDINWDQIEAFEPNLDVWAISSYPYIYFPKAEDIPEDYYSPLLDRTSKPLAVAEGGYSSQPVGPFYGSPDDQIKYLQAIHNQLNSQLKFWVYLLLNDINFDSYIEQMQQEGMPTNDIQTLSLFSHVGLMDVNGSSKPALKIWDSFYQAKE